MSDRGDHHHHNGLINAGASNMLQRAPYSGAQQLQEEDEEDEDEI